MAKTISAGTVMKMLSLLRRIVLSRISGESTVLAVRASRIDAMLALKSKIASPSESAVEYKPTAESFSLLSFSSLK